MRAPSPPPRHPPPAPPPRSPDNKGITSETQYPYTAADGTCNKAVTSVATIDSFTDVPANSETALLTAIVLQPISVAVEADQDSFQSYKSGVMTAACGTALDHGVLAVGYGTSGSQDYYKVRARAVWARAGRGAGVRSPRCARPLAAPLTALQRPSPRARTRTACLRPRPPSSPPSHPLARARQVKNSWGASWGDKGYIYLGRGAAFNPDGQCGIQMMASYPNKK